MFYFFKKINYLQRMIFPASTPLQDSNFTFRFWACYQQLGSKRFFSLFRMTTETIWRVFMIKVHTPFSNSAYQISLSYFGKRFQSQSFWLTFSEIIDRCSMKFQMFSDFAIIGKKSKKEHLKDTGLRMRACDCQHKTGTLSPNTFRFVL